MLELIKSKHFAILKSKMISKTHSSVKTMVLFNNVFFNGFQF